MKQCIINFVLRQILQHILADRANARYVVGLAEASRDDGDSAFVRRGKVYRTIKEWAPQGTPLYLVNLATEMAQTLDEVSTKK